MSDPLNAEPYKKLISQLENQYNVQLWYHLDNKIYFLSKIDLKDRFRNNLEFRLIDQLKKEFGR